MLIRETIELRIVRIFDEPANGDDGTVGEEELVQLGQLRLPNLKVIDVEEV